MYGSCKCAHHGIVKILAGLTWLAGVLFFWSGLKGMAVWGYEPLFYGWSVVVFSLMAFSCKFCSCCSWGKMKEGTSGYDKTCSHQSDCKCGDCDRCC